MKYCKLIICLIIVLLILSGCSKKYHLKRNNGIPLSEWPDSRYNLQSTASVDSEFSGQLNVIWEAQASDAPIGPLTICAGSLIMPGSKGRISFFDPHTGRYQGRIKSKRGVQTGIVTADSLAYMGIGPRKNRLVCFNLHNRKELWRRDLKDVTGAPIIIDNRIYTATASNLVLCLDRMTGIVIWKDSIAGSCKAGPSYGDGIVYYPCDNGELRGYNEMTGTLEFELLLEQPLLSKAAVDDRIYVADIGGGFYAIDRDSKMSAWERNFDWPIWTSPAVDDETVYVGDNGGNVHALDKVSGNPLWTFGTGGVILSSPIVVGEYLVFASLDRFVYCLNKKTGNLKSKRFFSDEVRFPAVVSGKSIIVALQNGSIQCLGD